MKEYNLILIFSPDGEKILFCYRMKPPYEGKYNLIGGKIEKGETGFQAAYRELFEETGISRKEIELYHLSDFTYYAPPMKLETYVGRLKKEGTLVTEKNPLHWISHRENFFDREKFAGDGNIGHLVICAEEYGFGEKE